MMLNVDFAELRSGFARYLPVGLALAIALAAEVIIAVGAYGAGAVELGRRVAVIKDDVPNIEAIGTLLYTRYLFVFEGAGFVLLVAMIGAIVLTHRERSGVRSQNVSRQVARRPQDAVRKTQPTVGQGVEL
jgi:NADH-quinone oxidoreductase subunit J